MKENLKVLFKIAERFIRTLKNRIFKYMNSVSKNVYINKLDDVGNEYSNTYHSSIKMKPPDVKSNVCINSSKEIDNKDSKFKRGSEFSSYKIELLN